MSRTERKGAPTPVADLAGLVGQEVGVSRWITVDQARIDAFAEITEDRQFIHIDPVAAAKTPFGGTIAHGFLTLSLLSAMTYDAVPPLAGVVMGVNGRSIGSNKAGCCHGSNATARGAEGGKIASRGFRPPQDGASGAPPGIRAGLSGRSRTANAGEVRARPTDG